MLFRKKTKTNTLAQYNTKTDLITEIWKLELPRNIETATSTKKRKKHRHSMETWAPVHDANLQQVSPCLTHQASNLQSLMSGAGGVLRP
jgi:hypothetical protein